MCAEGLDEGCAICLVVLAGYRLSSRWRKSATLLIHACFYRVFVVGF